jgi:glycine/serine hydroxymethyltransferase
MQAVAQVDEAELASLYASLSADEAKSVRGLSLTANESCLSRTAQSWLGSALANRYHLGVPGRPDADERYVTVSNGGLMRMGLPAVTLLERHALAAARRLFSAAVSDLRPLSGMHATTCVIALLTEPGDVVMSVDPEHGGHGVTAGLMRRLGRRPCFMPWLRDEFRFDVAATAAACRERGVSMLFVDLGTTLFPLPVRALREAVGPHVRIVYDGSHNLGLIAGGAFPNPLQEGADVLFGSAHKTFPGPQKAMVHFADAAWGEAFCTAMEETLIASQHTGDSLALYTAMLEMERHGAAYADATVRNARRLASALSAEGLRVIARSGEATRSGTFWLLPPEGTSNREACTLLMRARMATNARRIGGEEVLRIGVQYVTRQGMDGAAMETIARAFARVLLHRERPETVHGTVDALLARHASVQYSFDAIPGAARAS